MVDHSDDGGFNPDELYDQFPRGADAGYGPEQGYNEFIRLNDPSLFTDAARANPIINAFLEAPFSVTYVQFKSSYRESEYFIHKPHVAMAGDVEGIEGSVDNFPRNNPHIGTYVINHDRTLAWRVTRSLIIEDGAQAGQIIHKEAGS